MITKITDLTIALDFIVNVYKNTIAHEDSEAGQNSFVNNYVYGKETYQSFNIGKEEYYGYYLEKLTGVISLNSQGYVKYLFVDPMFKGQGIGRKLLAYVTTLPRKRNISQIPLDSSISNVGFYLKEGFVKISDVIVKDEIKYIPMEKILTK